MAEVTYDTIAGVGVDTNVQWETVTESDTFQALRVGFQKSLAGCLQVTGTFGGATVALHGSNDGTNFYLLKDLQGVDAELTAAGLIEFTTAALYVKPVASGGSSQSVTANLVLRG